MFTPEYLLAKLAANPHPKQTHLEMAGGFAYITINGHKIAYNGERWFACGQQITPRFSMNSLHREIDRVFGLAQKIKAHVLDKTTTPTWEEIKADCVGPDLTTVEQKEQTTMTAEQLHNILSNHPYPDANNLTQVTSELMYFNVDGLWIGYDKGIWKAELHLKQYPITPNFPPFGELTVRDVHAEISRVVKIGKSLHANTRAVAVEAVSTEQTFVSIYRYWELEAELKTMTASRDATQERVEALQQLLPLFCLGVNAPTDKAREKIEGLYSRVKELGLLANDLTDKLKTVTEERDELSVRVKQKTDVITAQAAQIQQHSDGWEQTEAQLEAMTTERDELQRRITSIKGELSDACAQLDDAGKSIDRLAGECDRLKSKAGLLSVVCRRLCGDENASIETVHKALDLFDDQRNALDYIGEKVYCDADPDAPHRLQSIGRLAAQMSKSLSEKTVEVAKLQEGLTNYQAQVEGLTKRVEQLAFERDAERVGNKWKAETIEDLQRTTVKLPNELTLRRLFNRHNTPDKYREGTPIPTMERLLMLIESLESQVSVQTRRAEHMALVNCHHEAMISDTHAILDEHGVQSYAGDTYLGIPARLRQLFATHTKV